MLAKCDKILSMSGKMLSMSDEMLAMCDKMLSMSDEMLAMSDEVLYMSDEMFSFSRFIYTGKTLVDQTDVVTFLETAKLFQVILFYLIVLIIDMFLILVHILDVLLIEECLELLFSGCRFIFIPKPGGV